MCFGLWLRCTFIFLTFLNVLCSLIKLLETSHYFECLDRRLESWLSNQSQLCSVTCCSRKYPCQVMEGFFVISRPFFLKFLFCMILSFETFETPWPVLCNAAIFLDNTITRMPTLTFFLTFLVMEGLFFVTVSFNGCLHSACKASLLSFTGCNGCLQDYFLFYTFF